MTFDFYFFSSDSIGLHSPNVFVKCRQFTLYSRSYLCINVYTIHYTDLQSTHTYTVHTTHITQLIINHICHHHHQNVPTYVLHEHDALTQCETFIYYCRKTKNHLQFSILYHFIIYRHVYLTPENFTTHKNGNCIV